MSFNTKTSDMKYGLYLLLIVLLGFIFRMTFQTGVALDASVQMAEEAWVFQQRMGDMRFDSLIDFSQSFSPSSLKTSLKTLLFILPVSGVYKFFGVSDITSVAYPLVSSLLTTVMIYLIGWRWFRESVGLLAAFVWAVNPLDIIYSTALLPVAPLVAMIASAIFLLSLRLSRSLSVLIACLAPLLLFVDADALWIAVYFYISLEMLDRYRHIPLFVISLLVFGGALLLLSPGALTMAEQSFRQIFQLPGAILLVPLAFVTITTSFMQNEEDARCLLKLFGVLLVVVAFGSLRRQCPGGETACLNSIYLLLQLPLALLAGQYLATSFSAIAVRNLIVPVTIGLILLFIPLPLSRFTQPHAPGDMSSNYWAMILSASLIGTGMSAFAALFSPYFLYRTNPRIRGFFLLIFLLVFGLGSVGFVFLAQGQIWQQASI